MKLLSRKPIYNFDSFDDTGLEDISLNSTIFIKETDSYYVYRNNSTVDSSTTLREAYDNNYIIASKLDGKDINGFMPNPYNLPISRAGDQSFLELPVYTDYKGSAYPLRGRDALVAGSDGRIYMYQLRSNFVEKRIYISYITQDLIDSTFTSQEYRPTFLSNDEYIDWIYEATESGMCARVNNTNGASLKYYWIFYNQTENPAYHTFKDITSLWPSGSYPAIIFIEEKNIFLVAYVEGNTNSDDGDVNSKYIYTFYDYDLNYLNRVFGLKTIWSPQSGNLNGTDFLYPNETYRVFAPHFHTGYTQLQYKIIGNEIYVKNFISILYYLSKEKSYLYPDYIDSISFNISTNNIQFINPVDGLPIDVTDSSHSYLNLGSPAAFESSYWSRYKIYKLFGNLYEGKTIATNSREHHLSKLDLGTGNLYMTYEEAFDNNFNWKIFDDGSTRLIPPDNSPSGKNIQNVNIVKLLDGSNVPRDYATLFGFSKDTNSNDIISSSVLISGVDIHNLSNYIPTKIESIPRNPCIVYLKDTENYNRLYDIPRSQDSGSDTSNITVREFFKILDLKNDNPSQTFNFTFTSNFKQQLINEVKDYITNDIGVVPDTWYTCSIQFYPIIDSDFLMVSIQQPYLKSTTSPGVSTSSCFFIVNPSTETIVNPLEEYYSAKEWRSLSPVSVISNYGISIFDNTSDGHYYIWAYIVGYCPIGGNNSAIRRFKINKTTGNVVSHSGISGVALASWEYTASGIHPDLGFYTTDVYSPHQYLAANFRNSSNQDLVDAWNQNPSLNGTCASIRSSVGMQITFSEYPVMFNGHYEIMPFQTIENLSPNTKYYVYLFRSSGGKLNYEFSKSILPETLSNIYIGWVQTDNVGISESSINKVVNINNLKINESDSTLLAPTLTLDRIQAGGNKSLVTKEYVDSLNTVFYINPISGDDTNRGTSPDQAFRTIKKGCDAIPIGGYGRLYLIGGPDFNNAVNFDIDSSIYLYKKNIYITVYSKYPYNSSENLLWAHCILSNKSQLIDRKHCDPNDNTLYTFVHGFRLYGSSLTISGQAVYRDPNDNSLHNKQTLRIKTPDWLPDPNDGNIYLYGCSHNNGLVCNESLGGGSLEIRYIDEINLGDSNLVSQSLAYQAVDISLTSILNIYGSGANNRAYISGTISNETPVMKIASYYVTFGNDKDGNAYTWQNSIQGVVYDSTTPDPIPRNIQASFVF